MKNIVFDNYGGPEVLKVVNASVPEIKDDEVLIRHTAIGVNHIDIQLRRGEIKGAPMTCGTEACGIIEKVGANVGGYTVGDRVVYVTGPIGAYATKRAINANYIIKSPDDISDEALAASMLKGMTAHYLVHRAFIISKGMGILIHDAASELGRYLTAWAASLGAFIIGTVGNDNDKQSVLESGCHHVFNYKEEDWVSGVMKCTEGFALNAVYDSIGQDTFSKSLDCLRMCGIMISYGYSSGLVTTVDLEKLRNKSLFLTCPTLEDYKSNRKELLLSAEEVFSVIREGVIKVNIGARYPLTSAVEAHRALEAGQSGSVVLIP